MNNSIFIIPALAATTEPSEIIELCDRAGVQVVSIVGAKLHEAYPFFLADEPTVIQMDVEHISLLSRHSAQLLPVLPVAIVGVPGAVYTRDYDLFVNSFPPEEWETFRRRLQKSGTVANNLDQLQHRSKSSAYSDDLGGGLHVDSPRSSAGRTFDDAFRSNLDHHSKGRRDEQDDGGSIGE